MQLTLFPSDSLSSYRFFINTGKNFKRRLYTQQKFSYHLLSIQYRSEHRRISTDMNFQPSCRISILR